MGWQLEPVSSDSPGAGHVPLLPWCHCQNAPTQETASPPSLSSSEGSHLSLATILGVLKRRLPSSRPHGTRGIGTALPLRGSCFLQYLLTLTLGNPRSQVPILGSIPGDGKTSWRRRPICNSPWQIRALSLPKLECPNNVYDFMTKPIPRRSRVCVCVRARVSPSVRLRLMGGRERALKNSHQLVRLELERMLQPSRFAINRVLFLALVLIRSALCHGGFFGVLFCTTLNAQTCRNA